MAKPTKAAVHDRTVWLLILPGLGLILLLALPLVALAWRAVQEGLLHYALTPMALSALRLSVLTSTVTVALAMLTGTPLAYALARWHFRGRAGLELLIDLPIVLPPAVAGLGLLVAFGRQGMFAAPLNLLGITIPFTTGAVVLAQTFVAAPFYVRSARIGFASVDRKLEESGHVEGANQWQLFRYIMVPLSSRAILTGAILCWTRALGEFGATILFAGNLQGRTQTMPLAIYLGFERSLGVALALSVMLIVTSFGLLAVTRRLEQRT